MVNENAIFQVDSNRRELADHKTNEIPCAAYVDRYYNSSYHWHWHDELEITFVTEGAIETFVNNERYILNENDGIFINSGVIHKYGSGIENAVCVMPNVVFHPNFICGENNSMHQKYVTPILNSVEFSHRIFRSDNESDKPFLECIRNAYNAAENKDWGYEFKLRERLSELLLLLYPLADNNAHSEISADIYRLRMMMDFIKNNFSSHIKLSDIASAAGVSVRECQRCFEKGLKITPMQYITELRIDLARRLLAETTEEISVICEKCGFSDQSYFTKVFRNYVGLPPLKFRRNLDTANLSQ